MSDLWARLTFGQMYPLAETSCGQVGYYFGQVDLWSDVPLAETSCGHMCYYFGWIDLWSDIPPDRDILWPNVILLQVRLIFSQIFESG